MHVDVQAYVQQVSICSYLGLERMLHYDQASYNNGGKISATHCKCTCFNFAHLQVGCDSRSFTRVVIGDLKPDVLAQLQDEAGAQALLRDLAHLYHYYLHGARGNAFT
jgi:hypothetical protein